MFLGYQNNKVMFLAKNKKELEELNGVILDEIKETNEDWQMVNGECRIGGLTQEEFNQQRIDELQAYLTSTDWYAVRYAETGVAIPENVASQRASAREEISTLRGDVEGVI